MSRRRLLLTLILLAQWSILSAGNFYQSQTINESDYWNLVQRAYDTVQDNQTDENNLRTKVSELAFEFQDIASVQLNNGEIVPIDNSLLVTEMLSPSSTAESLLSMLKALLDAHDQFPDRAFSIADLDSLKAITSRPEFQWRQAETNPFIDWVQEMLDKFFRWLDKFFRWLDKLLGGGQASGNGEAGRPSIIPFVASILLVGLLIFVFRTLFADLINEARTKNADDESQVPLTADAAFEKAQSLSHSGDYRSAVRYLYLSSLLMLDERGLLRYDRSKTNREYLRSVAKSPELAGPLAEVIDVFDNVWYGYHTLDEETFQHYSKRVEELKEKKQ